MRILMIGDVVGKPGRRAVEELLPALKQEMGLDLVIANSENAAGGTGLTVETAQQLIACGVDVLTSGNHIWDKKEIMPFLDGPLPILRPMNYPPGVPGHGYVAKGKALVANLMGRVFMTNIDCPFRAMDHFLSEAKPASSKVIIVDFHAEATSEKVALGWFLDGRVSAVLGTHTHVATDDLRILPKGTAYVTDVGMVGAVDSVIGVEKEAVIERFLSRIPRRFEVARGRVAFNSVVVEIDDSSGKAVRITRVNREIEEE